METMKNKTVNMETINVEIEETTKNVDVNVDTTTILNELCKLQKKSNYHQQMRTSIEKQIKEKKRELLKTCPHPQEKRVYERDFADLFVVCTDCGLTIHPEGCN